MTKFILHGGMTSFECENNKNFYKEIIKDLPENPKVLISLFSIEEERWEVEYENNKNSFAKNLGNLGFEFKLASKENFIEELEWADAAHFRGGNTLMLLEAIEKYPEFKEKLSGKTISGSSAGALFLVDNFYDQDHSEIFKGLGIININLITHSNSETYGLEPEEILEKLKDLDSGELVLLGETKYKVLNLNL